MWRVRRATGHTQALATDLLELNFEEFAGALVLDFGGALGRQHVAQRNAARRLGGALALKVGKRAVVEHKEAFVPRLCDTGTCTRVSNE